MEKIDLLEMAQLKSKFMEIEVTKFPTLFVSAYAPEDKEEWLKEVQRSWNLQVKPTEETFKMFENVLQDIKNHFEAKNIEVK